MKKLYYILIILIFTGCKENSTEVVKASNISETPSTKTKIKESKTKSQENCYDYLTELVRSSNFPFNDWNINPKKVNLIIDEDNGTEITAKLFFDSDGTGTIGWIKYNIRSRSLFNTSANLEQPEKLTFNSNWAFSLEKCIGIVDVNKMESSNSNSFSKIYTDAKEVSLPLQYSYDFLNDEKSFLILPEKYYSIFKLQGVQNYKIAKLPIYKNFSPILLKVYQLSGQSDLYMITLDKSFKMIDKIILYTSKEVDSGNLSTTYEVTTDYHIKIKEVLLIDQNSKVLENNKKTKNYIINDKGQIITNN